MPCDFKREAKRRIRWGGGEGELGGGVGGGGREGSCGGGEAPPLSKTDE